MQMVLLPIQVRIRTRVFRTIGLCMVDEHSGYVVDHLIIRAPEALMQAGERDVFALNRHIYELVEQSLATANRRPQAVVVPPDMSLAQLQRRLGLLDANVPPLVLTHAHLAGVDTLRSTFTRQMEAFVATLPGGHAWDSGHGLPLLEDAELMTVDAFATELQHYLERWNLDAPDGQRSRHGVWAAAYAVGAPGVPGRQDG